MTDLPRKPSSVRLALLLLLALVFLRMWLYWAAAQDTISLISHERVSSETPSSGEVQPNSQQDHWVQMLRDLQERPRAARGFGNPLLMLLVVPSILMLRRFVRKGHFLAAQLLVALLALRALMILLRGPWNGDAVTYLLMIASASALLLSPSARHWFESCAQVRDEVPKAA